MTDADADADGSLRAAERRLQAAQLGSDLAEPDALIDERLLFTSPDGSLMTKADDLGAHRSGAQALQHLTSWSCARVVGSTGVTWLLADLAGSFNGAPFAARMRHTRTWVRDDQGGWKVVAAQAGPALPS